MQAQSVFRYGRTTVELFDGWVRTTLPDGTAVHAVPRATEEDRARAVSLGYGGDVWHMTRDHDRFHALLAYALGMSESPALRQSAEGRQSELAGAEEEAVLAIQRFANLCRVERLL